MQRPNRPPPLAGEKLIQRPRLGQRIVEKHLRAAPRQLLRQGRAFGEGRDDGDGGEFPGCQFGQQDSRVGGFGDGEFGW